MTAVSTSAATHILIAEDSATQAQRLQHILERQGYRVTAAANGRLALDAARLDLPALIISDVVMPEMTGYELCRQVKADACLGDVPVILVTTLSDPQDVIRGLECRADNFILKPYDAEQLLRRIQFVLVNNHMRPSDESGMGLEIVFGGQRHFITADRLQILSLLLSTYEAAMQRNQELSSTRDALRQSNGELQRMTHELEERVRLRTRELESSHEALRQAQNALVQQERLSALGQMASGIAHDINNAISPISLYSESLLNHETALSAAGRNRLMTIQRAIDDVAQTVARMREFYRPQEPRQQLANVQLNTLVGQVVELTRARWNDQPQRKGIMIELKSELDDGAPDILGADYEIRDAITNLIFNAVDAVPQGGTITVRTRSSAGASVTLEVADNGIGMDDATRQRCLEPFFTTKGKRGTGLGLAMVYGMAKRHGAILDIDSTPGTGSVFSLQFPVSTRTEAETDAGNDSPITRALRILVIDDDPILAESLSDTLRQEGHSVDVAGGGQAGIDAFHSACQSAQPFDAVITDLGMPYVDGRQVANAVRIASPRTPIIMLSGWGPRLSGDAQLRPSVDRMFAKPPRLREIRAALRELCPADTAAPQPQASTGG